MRPGRHMRFLFERISFLFPLSFDRRLKPACAFFVKVDGFLFWTPIVDADPREMKLCAHPSDVFVFVRWVGVRRTP
jgi:hypothetical protein